MSISLLSARYRGEEKDSPNFKTGEMYLLKVYGDSQFPIIIELKNGGHRRPYSTIDTFLNSWSEIIKVGTIDH